MPESVAMTERNNLIWNRYKKNDITQTALAKEFHMTRSRINQIILSMEKKEKSFNVLMSKEKDFVEDICFRDRMIILFDFINTLVYGSIRKSKASVHNTIYSLFRGIPSLYNANDPKECFNNFMDLTYNEIIKTRNIGEHKANIVMKIQDIIRQNDIFEELLLTNCKYVYSHNKWGGLTV